MSIVVRTAVCLGVCARALGAIEPSPDAANLARIGQAGTQARSRSDRHLITGAAMGRVRLNMTLDEARRLLPAASFARTSDGDRAALVEVALGQDVSLILRANEDDADAPIDWAKRIVAIETFSAAFHTREGVGPGSLVGNVIEIDGPVREIVESEIESRQYITFDRQPKGLRLRLDYTGIFTSGERRTTRYQPDAKILSVAISSFP
jgi:hypothetical protein